MAPAVNLPPSAWLSTRRLPSSTASRPPIPRSLLPSEQLGWREDADDQGRHASKCGLLVDELGNLFPARSVRERRCNQLSEARDARHGVVGEQPELAATQATIAPHRRPSRTIGPPRRCASLESGVPLSVSGVCERPPRSERVCEVS